MNHELKYNLLQQLRMILHHSLGAQMYINSMLKPLLLRIELYHPTGINKAVFHSPKPFRYCSVQNINNPIYIKGWWPTFQYWRAKSADWLLWALTRLVMGAHLTFIQRPCHKSSANHYTRIINPKRYLSPNPFQRPKLILCLAANS